MVLINEVQWVPALDFTEYAFDLQVASHRTTDLPLCCKKRAHLHVREGLVRSGRGMLFRCSICGARWARISERVVY